VADLSEWFVFANDIFVSLFISFISLYRGKDFGTESDFINKQFSCLGRIVLVGRNGLLSVDDIVYRSGSNIMFCFAIGDSDGA
jgi:hypothetical protein